MIIKSADMALEQSEEALRGIDWSAYGDILMIGKSIGTIAGSKYARRYGIDCRQIHFSPAEETFEFAGEKGIVFHGTVDRWVDTKVVERRCAEKELSLYEIEGANHSLEKGDVEFDIETIKKTMRIIREYALSRYADKIANDLQNAAVTLLADNPDKMPQTDDSTAIPDELYGDERAGDVGVAQIGRRADRDRGCHRERIPAVGGQL